MGNKKDVVGSKRKSKKNAPEGSKSEDVCSEQVTLALSLVRAGKAKEAKIILLAVKESSPHLKNSPEVRHVEGLLCYFEGDIDGAIGILEKVKQGSGEVEEWLVKSRSMRDQLLLGNNLSKQHESYSAAAEAYEMCLRFDPSNLAYMAKVHWRRALLHESHSHLEEAEADLTASLVIEPENLRVLNKRAAVRIELNQLDAALEDLQVLQGVQPSKDSRKKIEEVQKKKILEEKRLKEEAEKKKAYEEMKEQRKKERERGSRNTSSNQRRYARKSRERERCKEQATFYEILGVDESASASTIRRAFKEKAKEFHPDKHSNAGPEELARMEEKMKEVSAAHTCLSDPEKRKDYDRKLAGGGGEESEEFEDGEDFFFDFIFARMGGRRCDCCQSWN